MRRGPPGRAAAALLALAVLVAPAATPAANVALVVVNADHRDLADLDGIGVAGSVQGALAAAGFEVTVIENATTGALLSALRRLAASGDPDSAAVFYFTGYARQNRGRSYMLARNAKPSVPFDFVTQGVDLDSVLKALGTAGGRVQLAIVDGAYPEPLLDGLQGLDPGLADPAVPPSGAVVLGAAPGATLGDATGARALAGAFAAAVATPGEPLGTVLARFAALAERDAGRRLHVAFGQAAAERPLLGAAAPRDAAPGPAAPGPAATGSGAGAADPAGATGGAGASGAAGAGAAGIAGATGAATGAAETAAGAAGTAAGAAGTAAGAAGTAAGAAGTAAGAAGATGAATGAAGTATTGAAVSPALSPAEFEALLTLEERQRIQMALRGLGLYPGALDGDFGPMTRRGIATFQRLRGLDATGIVDAAQMRLLLDLAGQ